MEARRAETPQGERLGSRQLARKGAPDQGEFWRAYESRRQRHRVLRIEMPMAQGRNFLELIAELRASGAHESLDSVFADIQSELENSIEFVEGMLAGTGGIRRRLH